MSLFDFYIMVDWSGAMRRRGMRADTIWTAYGGIEAENPKTDSPFSRTEAIHLIHSLIEEQSRKMLRVLLCFDFAMAFPGIFPPRYRRRRAKPMPLFLGLQRGNI
jgi:hypothetical protein